MSPIEAFIRRPVTAVVGVVLVALFGALAAFRLPIQLTPDVDKPIVTVTTWWEGATPQEVELDVVDKQEEKLKRVEGVERMTSTSSRGRGVITLEFPVGTDLSRALLDVSEKLRQVQAYPENVDEPIISAGETEDANAIAWMVLQREADSPIAEEEVPRLQTLVEEEVKPLLERARGVATINAYGGVEREVHVRVDPALLAARRLSLLEVRDVLRRHNLDLSAGTLDRGKHALAVRSVGRFERLDEVRELVLARRDGAVVRLREVAEVGFGFKKPIAFVRSCGAPAIAMNATRQAGTNVITVMRSLKDAVKRANEQVLAPRGLRLVQVYDQTDYIFSAIDLVVQNLYVGGGLAVLILLLFLREIRGTLLIGIAIPISVVGSFIGLAALGRNLNVVSLAGLAFAVGMVVDNSIVVLENIHRHRQEGKGAFAAALEGAEEVWGAVLASTLTTLAVFVPVLFIEEEAGQLFRDIAIAISSAVFLSLLVSVLFIPAAAAVILPDRAGHGRGRFSRLFGLVPLAAAFVAGVAGLVAWLNRGLWRRLAVAGGLTGAALGLSALLLPAASYLPGGNQNLVIGFMIPPPGYNLPEFERIANRLEGRLRPYWEAGAAGRREMPPALANPAWRRAPGAPIPPIQNLFFVAFGSVAFMGASSADPENVQPLEDLLRHAGGDIPGTFLFSAQTSLFERGLSSGNSIDLEVSGADSREIQQAAGALFGTILQAKEFQDPRLGPLPPRPEPATFDLAAPEVQVRLQGDRAAELGLAVAELGFVVGCHVDGVVVGEYRDRGVSIDLKLLAGPEGGVPVEELERVLVSTPAGREVPLGDLAHVVRTSAPNEIRRSEKKRSVKLVVTPPPGLELSRAMALLEGGLIPGLRAAGAIPPGVTTTLAGTADKLVSTRKALSGNFILAVVICYLLMAALFEHFLFPLLILFTVPLATVGGIVGLDVIRAFTGQQMDVLTMLGFVILVGTVVNNAILIVHQALNQMREAGMDPKAAVVASVRTRVRPIFMSTLTSIFGMLPLVVAPGAGSELYRGLGSVVVGGLVASTVFTLVLTPVLFSLTLGLLGRRRRGTGA